MQHRWFPRFLRPHVRQLRAVQFTLSTKIRMCCSSYPGSRDKGDKFSTNHRFSRDRNRYLLAINVAPSTRFSIEQRRDIVLASFSAWCFSIVLLYNAIDLKLHPVDLAAAMRNTCRSKPPLQATTVVVALTRSSCQHQRRRRIQILMQSN